MRAVLHVLVAAKYSPATILFKICTVFGIKVMSEGFVHN